MHWVLEAADIISAVFGIVSALFLGLPLLFELQDRRHWDRLGKLEGRDTESMGTPGADRELRDIMIDQRMGDYQRYRVFAIFGFGFLMLAFILALVAGIARTLH